MVSEYAQYSSDVLGVEGGEVTLCHPPALRVVRDGINHTTLVQSYFDQGAVLESLPHIVQHSKSISGPAEADVDLSAIADIITDSVPKVGEVFRH